MTKMILPLDENGIFRRRTCDYLIDKNADDLDLRCTHPQNNDKYCCLDNCPIISNSDKTKEIERRKVLKHTPPLQSNKKISFPDHHKGGRIRHRSGVRLIDWEEEVWKPFVKDGSQWYPVGLNDDDYSELYDCLIEQIKSLF